jgi:hypothetical protein
MLAGIALTGLPLNAGPTAAELGPLASDIAPAPAPSRAPAPVPAVAQASSSPGPALEPLPPKDKSPSPKALIAAGISAAAALVLFGVLLCACVIRRCKRRAAADGNTSKAPPKGLSVELRRVDEGPRALGGAASRAAAVAVAAPGAHAGSPVQQVNSMPDDQVNPNALPPAIMTPVASPSAPDAKAKCDGDTWLSAKVSTDTTASCLFFHMHSFASTLHAHPSR